MSSTPDMQDYVFSPSPNNDSTWTRKCYGVESLLCAAMEHVEGFPFLVTTVAITTARSYSRPLFETALKEAWATLRFSIPGIAVKSGRLPPPDNRFTLTYPAPRRWSDVKLWVDETVFVGEELEDAYRWHRKLKNGRWWKPSVDHWVGEIHACPTENGWQLSLVFNHNSIDGRSAFGLCEELLNNLTHVLEGSASPASQLAWGEETKRLPPAPVVLTTEAGLQPRPSELPKLSKRTPWIWSALSVAPPLTEDVSVLCTLSTKTTAKLHALGKAHGRTITQVVAALSVLAHSEHSLAMAQRRGGDRTKEVIGGFRESEVYKIEFTFSNYRHKFPEAYRKLTSETPGPLTASDAMPLFFPMAPVRDFFTTTDDGHVQVKHELTSAETERYFWDTLVKVVAESWDDHDISLQGLANREAGGHFLIHASPADVQSLITKPSLMISSIGDLGRLDILQDYVPSNSAPSETQHASSAKTLTVSETICGQRMRVPALMNLFWQYDGRLRCQWSTGGEWTSQDEIEEVVRLFERWTERVISR